ncbi:hypothetical protein TW95_gp0629 [Pandoravirus inopinatum]|uniref:Uncharacterized protein n=1 Tax=Pandoravirus inopinatum TaxID=1605721 RepID=A0A0B5IX95_9VIRU|nr:hypothetical protein TW95_gp0629 [Pandoravirus inopinatum]AJF97363.1 hypothetical protein [Pandoravirus inopinatum]
MAQCKSLVRPRSKCIFLVQTKQARGLSVHREKCSRKKNKTTEGAEKACGGVGYEVGPTRVLRPSVSLLSRTGLRALTEESRSMERCHLGGRHDALWRSLASTPGF